jgi:ketosteroid isomerase-like protein
MGAEDNLQIAKDAYAAFSAGDAAGAMEKIADDVEWVVPGDSSVSGTKNGKQEVGELWGTLAEKDFSTAPEHWFADGDMVAVFVHQSVGGQETDAADLLTYNADGKLVKFQTTGNESILKEVFG